MNLFERAKNIIVTPKTEWEVIKGEQSSASDLFTKYVLIRPDSYWCFSGAFWFL